MMPHLSLTALALLAVSCAAAAAEDYKLSRADAAPEGVSEAIAGKLDPQGFVLTGPQRPFATLWLVKAAAIPADFQPSAAVRYPFSPGQLIGALVVPKRSGFRDFRGNELEEGAYTLRYGRQPMDGNHIGTSDLADFLLALPAEHDEDPATVSDLDQLVQISAEASGTTHPAIFSLQPVEKTQPAATLTHDEPREFWILQVNAAVQRAAKQEQLPIRLVVVGVAEG